MRLSSRLMTFTLLVSLTGIAILVQGFHSGVEDDEIYLPSIKKLLSPALYPHDSQYFVSQTKPFALLRIVAASVRVTHFSVAWVQLLWQIASIFLLLAASYRLSTRCFSDLKDRWGAVALVAGLLTLPVAGTSLYIADQYLHPRTLASAALLFAIAALLDRRFNLVLLWGVATLLLHPLMAAFGIAYLIVLALPIERWWQPNTGMLGALPMPFITHPNAAWREAASTREYYFLLRWTWFGWLGIFAPMVLLLWFSLLGEKLGLSAIPTLAKRLVLYSVIMSAAGMVAGIPARLDWLAPTQPMRHLHLVYLLMMLMGGGLLAHYVLRNRISRWLLLFIPLFAGMFYAQRNLFPTSPHIEVPGIGSANRWVQCFRWIRQNTPQDAYFAVDPKYMDSPGEENFGFRAIAERSKLADWSKDAAVVAIAADLAPMWKQQVDSLRGYKKFTRADFLRLKAEFGVTWALVEEPVQGLPCPYHQDQLAVCQIE